MRRLALTLLLLATTATAQAPPAAPGQAAVLSPGEQCLANQPAVNAYNATLKASRDTVEQDGAYWRAQAALWKAEADRLAARVRELEIAKPAP